MEGSIDEDNNLKSVNHFYDPVYNQGWVGYRSSKVWARSSSAQQEKISLLALNPITSGFLSDDWPDDFSYERALLDYARGDADRAFEAFGHVLHLLEDASVLEHTRNDTHIGIHTTGSPYEKEMGKWNTDNLFVAENIKKSGGKPVLFNNLDDYFDSVAGYSNGYFFSEDTIFSERYNKPEVFKIKKIQINEEIFSFLVGLDRGGNEFNLALIGIENLRNFFEVKNATLANEVIGSMIIDSYWDRLSKDFILNGAGALNMFLSQAEVVKSEYEKQLALENSNEKSFWDKLFGAILPGNDEP